MLVVSALARSHKGPGLVFYISESLGGPDCGIQLAGCLGARGTSPLISWALYVAITRLCVAEFQSEGLL